MAPQYKPIKALPRDPTSQANWQDIPSQHIDFDWTIDFATKVIRGSATHTLLAQKNDLEHVLLDTFGLSISKVEINDDPAGVPYQLGDKDPVMGSALRIPLSPAPAEGSTIKVTVRYQTTAECLALGWLEIGQTMGKSFPYLFSQCQPIYMRSLAPCQDTPSVKTTYSAVVSSTLPALMSGLRVSPPVDGPPHDGKVIGKDVVKYTYHQPVPIASYLIAIAAGNVVYQKFPQPEQSWTSGVWSEPELIDSAYEEFKNYIPRFIQIDEESVGPYQWGVYDILVLPPAFPYGGMENACLTFATPALIVGDHSLVDVAAHEISHSWYGNLVTHANADHFWLNEGWATYMERVLQEKYHNSPPLRDFSYIIGKKALDDALKLYEDIPKYQRLVINFDVGENPDDAYSDVPYEKGSNFILYLERILGGLDVFLPYARDYATTFSRQSITTEQWKDHLYAYWSKNGGSEKTKILDGVDWNAWFYGEGLSLPVEMKYDETLATPCYDLAAKWDRYRNTDPSTIFKPSDIADFETNQKIVFLQTLQSYNALPETHVDAIANIYGFCDNPNVEISFPFYQVALQDPTSSAARNYMPRALDWVVGKTDGMVKGRMKYNRPIFVAASKVDYDYTVKMFRDHQDAFHPIAQSMIEKDLNLTPSSSVVRKVKTCCA